MEVQDRRKITAPKNGLLGGRPKGGISVSVQEYRRAITEYLAKRIADEIVPIVDGMMAEAKQGNVMAFVALLDRAYGKVPQGVIPTDQNGQPIVFMPPELIEKYNLTTQEKDNVKVIDVKHEEIKSDEINNGSIEPEKK